VHITLSDRRTIKWRSTACGGASLHFLARQRHLVKTMFKRGSGSRALTGRMRTTSRATCQAGVRYTVVVTSSVVVLNAEPGDSAPLAALAMSAAVPSLGSVSTACGAARTA